jgi:hypothetical protein
MVDLQELVDALNTTLTAEDRNTWAVDDGVIAFVGPQGLIQWNGEGEGPDFCFAMLGVLRASLAYWDTQRLDVSKTPNRAIARAFLRGYLMQPWAELSTEAVALAIIEVAKGKILLSADVTVQGGEV